MDNRLFSYIFSSTARTKSSLTTDGWQLRGLPCTFSRHSLKCLTHLLAIESLIARSPYLTKLTMNISRFHVSCIQEKCTDRISYAAGFSIFLNIVNTQDDAQTRFDYPQWLPCFRKGPTNSARMRTIVTVALQWQYLQTELILWIFLVLLSYT
jgi:hypothetical protein